LPVFSRSHSVGLFQPDFVSFGFLALAPIPSCYALGLGPLGCVFSTLPCVVLKTVSPMLAGS
jgi:hypothetical protein